VKYRLVYTHRAEKDISRLDPAVKRRIGNTLLRYENDPLKYAENYLIPNLATLDSELVIIGLSLTSKVM
jgi:mRNA interferase RelE/StbE